ncbi:MAG: hypothetical protein SFV17_13930, partial [Candidatus Obscuribacter sp.]|nr:hypothetical protein [Candidatus Obscuribacter sp.]
WESSHGNCIQLSQKKNYLGNVSNAISSQTPLNSQVPMPGARASSSCEGAYFALVKNPKNQLTHTETSEPFASLF